MIIYKGHYNYLTFKENKCKYLTVNAPKPDTKSLKSLERKIGAMCSRPNQMENENQSRGQFADGVHRHKYLTFQLSISPNPINWIRGNLNKRNMHTSLHLSITEQIPF